ncbi:MAG: hypothetical protein ACI9G1_003010 [Pirellulaceae bacterium]
MSLFVLYIGAPGWDIAIKANERVYRLLDFGTRYSSL